MYGHPNVYMLAMPSNQIFQPINPDCTSFGIQMMYGGSLFELIP